MIPFLLKLAHHVRSYGRFNFDDHTHFWMNSQKWACHNTQTAGRITLKLEILAWAISNSLYTKFEQIWRRCDLNLFYFWVI